MKRALPLMYQNMDVPAVAPCGCGGEVLLFRDGGSYGYYPPYVFIRCSKCLVATPKFETERWEQGRGTYPCDAYAVETAIAVWNLSHEDEASKAEPTARHVAELLPLTKFNPTTWPREKMGGGPYLCTAQWPMPKDAPKGFTWRHTASFEAEDMGETVRYECRNCGHTWTVELPE